MSIKMNNGPSLNPDELTDLKKLWGKRNLRGFTLSPGQTEFGEMEGVCLGRADYANFPIEDKIILRFKSHYLFEQPFRVEDVQSREVDEEVVFTVNNFFWKNSPSTFDIDKFLEGYYAEQPFMSDLRVRYDNHIFMLESVAFIP